MTVSPDFIPSRLRAARIEARAENFPVASRLLPRTLRRDVSAIYSFARTVDDIGDSAPGDRLALLDAVERDLDRVYAGVAVGAGWQALQAAIKAHDVPSRPFRQLLAANRQDQRQRRYQRYADLLGYCELSANPVGHLVLYVCDAASTDRMRLSDHVCTALQLLEHLQDVAEDLARGRVYLPQVDLDRFGCGEADLAAATATPALRRLIEFETARARSLLDLGAPLVRDLSGPARLAVAGYLAGGRATVAALTRARYDVLGRTVRPARSRTAAEWLRLLAGAGAWPA